LGWSNPQPTNSLVFAAHPICFFSGGHSNSFAQFYPPKVTDSCRCRLRIEYLDGFLAIAGFFRRFMDVDLPGDSFPLFSASAVTVSFAVGY